MTSTMSELQERAKAEARRRRAASEAEQHIARLEDQLESERQEAASLQDLLERAKLQLEKSTKTVAESEASQREAFARTLSQKQAELTKEASATFSYLSFQLLEHRSLR